MGLLQLLFSFKGRLNRQGFWAGISINFAFLFIVVNFFTYSTAFNPIMLFPLGVVCVVFSLLQGNAYTTEIAQVNTHLF